jgi:hypothetical protein
MLALFQKQDAFADGLRQRGLLRSEENPDNRRMKAVYLTANEILASLQARLLSLGLFKSLGNQLRQRRTAAKLGFLGACVHAVRMRVALRRRGKLLALGLAPALLRAKAQRLRAAKVAALGLMRRLARAVKAARVRTLVFALGVLASAQRARSRARHLTLCFALGLPLTLLRTQGSPQGFKYGVKAPPKPKGPRVRGIYWDELKDVKGSVWDRRATNVLLLRQLFPDLKAAFTEKEKEKKGGAGGAGGSAADEAKAKAAEEAAKKITFIDAKAAQNMGIALSKFKTVFSEFKERGFAQLREALDAMDEAACGGPEFIELLENQLVNLSEDNMAKAKGYSDEESRRMPMPESFVFEMCKVKRVAVRIKCLKLKASFGEMEAAVRKDLGLFALACNDVLSNKKLPVFLVDVIRPFGNELNRANGKKESTGIKISGLLKLAATKTADNSMTSLYYIVSVLAEHRKELLELVVEFKNVPAACRLSMAATEANLSACKKAMAEVQKAVADATKDGDQVFLDAIGAFAALVAEQVAALEAEMARLKADILLTAAYLGEKEKSDRVDAVAKPETLFAEWQGFVKVLQDTLNEYRAKEAKKAKAAKEAAEKAAAADAKAAKALEKAQRAEEKAARAAAAGAAAASPDGSAAEEAAEEEQAAGGRRGGKGRRGGAPPARGAKEEAKEQGGNPFKRGALKKKGAGGGEPAAANADAAEAAPASPAAGDAGAGEAASPAAEAADATPAS